MQNDLTILIADDEEEVLELLETKLQKQGFYVFSTTSGRDVYDIVKIKKPDLILLDILLPDIDGPEIAEMLQAHQETSDIPILFLSGIISNSQNSDKLSEVSVNGKFYKALGKPFTFHEVLSEVKKILNL